MRDNPDSVCFEVPRLFPTINTLTRKHWSYRHNQVTLAGVEIMAEIMPTKLRTLRAWAECKLKVRVVMIIYHTKLYDPDNVYSAAKIPLDALKSLRCIVDDSARWIDLVVTQHQAPEKRTKFEISRF